MKISKSLFLAFAGLGLFACSNEDVTENGVQGGADVTVTVNPQGLSRGSRAIDPSNPINGVNGDEQDVDINSIVVKLTAGVGSNEQKFTSMSELTNGTVRLKCLLMVEKLKIGLWLNSIREIMWDWLHRCMDLLMEMSLRLQPLLKVKQFIM